MGYQCFFGHLYKREQLSLNRFQFQTASSNTFATGAKQFVVQDAFEITSCFVNLIGRRLHQLQL